MRSIFCGICFCQKLQVWLVQSTCCMYNGIQTSQITNFWMLYALLIVCLCPNLFITGCTRCCCMPSSCLTNGQWILCSLVTAVLKLVAPCFSQKLPSREHTTCIRPMHITPVNQLLTCVVLFQRLVFEGWFVKLSLCNPWICLMLCWFASPNDSRNTSGYQHACQSPCVKRSNCSFHCLMIEKHNTWFWPLLENIRKVVWWWNIM